MLFHALLFYSSNPSYKEAKNWRVYGGAVSQTKLPTPFTVKKIILHESYSQQTNDYDIALLKLSAPVEFNSESTLHKHTAIASRLNLSN